MEQVSQDDSAQVTVEEGFGVHNANKEENHEAKIEKEAVGKPKPDSDVDMESSKAEPEEDNGNILEKEKGLEPDQQEDFPKKPEEDLEDPDQQKDSSEKPKEGHQEPEQKKNFAEKDEDAAEKEKKGLLDNPVVIEGKRVRRAVTRLITSTTGVIKKLPEAAGNGVPLGDIEYVNANIGKQPSEMLKGLHRLCFGTFGTVTSRKRDLRKFNGYSFDENSEDFKRKKAIAMKLTTAEVRAIRQVLGTEGGNHKEELVTGVLHFLLKPEDMGKKAPGGTKRKAAAGGRGKRGKKARKDKKGGDEKGDKKKKAQSGGSDSGDVDSDLSASDSEEEAKEDSDKGPSSSKGKVAAASKEKPTKNPKKARETANDTNAKAGKRWGPGGPSEEEMDSAIDDLLHSVDLVKFTMKQMCQQIGEKFPGLEMPVHKAALKERVKMALDHLDA